MFRLDRVKVEEVGANPARLAQAILTQLPDLRGAVPVYEIARALDIDEIREERTSSFEGCLLTDRNKSRGAILVNAASGLRRRRFSVGHELGHFLNERHVSVEGAEFSCTRQDMTNPAGGAQHRRQEQEANSFAIELLAPRYLIQACLNRPADLEHVLAIADDLQISREAAARRYVELHDECIAMVFSKGDRIRYVVKGEEFPATTVWANDAVPHLASPAAGGSGLTTLHDANPDEWLRQPGDEALYAQTLYQANDHAMTLLLAERDDEG